MRYKYSDFSINFFENVDTEYKAYILGILYADGNVSKNTNSVKLSLRVKDVDILEKIKKSMKLENELFFESNRPNVILKFTNKKIKEDLIKQGCTPNKTFTIKEPNLNRKLIHHFIRGYFDGDGSVSYGYNERNNLYFKLFFAGTYKLLNFINEYLPIKCENISEQGKIYRLQFGSKRSILTNLNYIYNNSDIFMDRKYEIYNDIKDIISNDISGSEKTQFKGVKVIQKDYESDDILGIFDSIKEAENKTESPSISQCCRGVIKSSGGYKWEYYYE